MRDSNQLFALCQISPADRQVPVASGRPTPNENASFFNEDLQPFLSGNMICLYGFEGERKDFYHKLVLRCGGMCRERVDEDTTHILAATVRRYPASVV